MEKSARTAASEVLKRILSSGAYSNIAVGNVSDSLKGNVSDKALCLRIVLTAVENAKSLDYIVSLLCKKKPDPTVRAIIFVGAVQILYMDRIPDSAACDETVKTAKILTDVKRAGFVNAVLRNICRQKEALLKKLETADDETKYSIDNSIIKLLKEQYPDRYAEIISAFSKEMPLFLRVNTKKTSVSELSELLEKSGCTTTVYDGFLCVISGASNALKLIEDGLFYVQGYASQYAVRMLGAKPNETVVDVCACPGGKCVGAGIDMENKGEIFAFDIHDNKFSLIHDTASKMGIDIIKTSKNDSRNVVLELVGKADRVICDVPCSALGVIASRPEIRYKNVSDLSALTDTQYKILCASAKYLKIGGTLVYSTCTFDKNENCVQTEKFIKEHNNYSVCEERQFLPDGITDGFYCCRITRNA